MPKGTQHQNLNLREKCEMLKKYDALPSCSQRSAAIKLGILPSCSQRSAAIKLGITQSTLSRLVRNREKISEDSTSNINPKRKRIRDGKDVAVENALLQWFRNVRTQNAPISRGILMEKAAILASKLGH
ncbi:Tc5 transposase DNA-binding domain [Popillia japonica]|uniref:Tc5 transposase DNA-binding domain n=1 Tax=Popillia japonica TaxID=7064 RepID=A0AAW1KP29_POPJA